MGAGCPRNDGGAGWYACVEDWKNLGLGDAGWQVYMNQLSWYDSEVRKDDYVIGFTVFTAGTSNVEGWRTYNIDDLLVPMAVYMNGQ